MKELMSRFGKRVDGKRAKDAVQKKLGG